MLNDDQDSEKFYGKRVISGMKCMITANNVNGIIKGSTSLCSSGKNLKFELEPILNGRFGEVVISKELDRLYFDVVLVNGKDKLTLMVKKKLDEWRCFIVKLQGSKYKLNALRLTNDNKNQQFLLATSISIKQCEKPYQVEVSKVISY